MIPLRQPIRWRLPRLLVDKSFNRRNLQNGDFVYTNKQTTKDDLLFTSYIPLN